jgi:hypothetical protein
MELIVYLEQCKTAVCLVETQAMKGGKRVDFVSSAFF